MTRHRRIYRADTSPLQGEGSYVEFTSPKVGDIRAIQAAETTRDYDLALDMLRNSIIAWNWSDEDGSPLPLPAESVDELHADEVGYLIRIMVAAKEDDLKN